jgi:transcriptional regulator with XRE-family HTH domain
MMVTRLGKTIKKRLIDLGRTQRSLAEALGVDPRYLSKIVRGKVGPGKYVSALARELDVSEEDLRRLLN